MSQQVHFAQNAVVVTSQNDAPSQGGSGPTVTTQELLDQRAPASQVSVLTQRQPILDWPGAWVPVLDSGIHSGADTAAQSVRSFRSIQSAQSKNQLEDLGDPEEWNSQGNLLPNTPASASEGGAAQSSNSGPTRADIAQLIEFSRARAARSEQSRAALFPESGLGSGSATTGAPSGGASGVASPMDSAMVGEGAPETAVGRLSGPSTMLQDAVGNLINYQDDADLATFAVPDLVRLLADEDAVVLHQSALMVHQLSKKEASRHALLASPDIVTTVVRLLAHHSSLLRQLTPPSPQEGSGNSGEVARYLCGTLHNFSHHRQGLAAIFAAGGVPVLVSQLELSLEPILFYSITTLHNLLLHQEGAKAAVREAGGIQRIAALLRSPAAQSSPGQPQQAQANVKFLAIATDCLQILTYANAENKILLLQCAAPAELVRIMRTHTYEKLLWTTSRLLKVLSVCSQNKPAIVSAGGVHALAAHLVPAQAALSMGSVPQNVGAGALPSTRLLHNCLWTLRNLSDAATRLEHTEFVLQQLIALLAANTTPALQAQAASQGTGPNGYPVDYQVLACCAGIISNLTCNNQTNKLAVCHMRGIETLVQTIQVAGDRDEILEPTICALRHLTCRHSEAEIAQHAVQLCGGLPLLSQRLDVALSSPAVSGSGAGGGGGALSSSHPNPRMALLKALVGLVRNVALNMYNDAPLRELGFIDRLVQVLLRMQQLFTLKTQGAQSGAVGGGGSHAPVTVEGVRIEELLEHATAALHILARDKANRQHIRNHNAVPLIVSLLYQPSENVVRVAAGLLCELSGDQDAVPDLESASAIAPLSELLHSRNDSIATYAAAVLYNVSEGKPDFRRRVTLEIQNSLIGRQPPSQPLTPAMTPQPAPTPNSLPPQYTPGVGAQQQGLQSVPQSMQFGNGSQHSYPPMQMHMQAQAQAQAHAQFSLQQQLQIQQTGFAPGPGSTTGRSIPSQMAVQVAPGQQAYGTHNQMAMGQGQGQGHMQAYSQINAQQQQQQYLLPQQQQQQQQQPQQSIYSQMGQGQPQGYGTLPGVPAYTSGGQGQVSQSQPFQQMQQHQYAPSASYQHLQQGGGVTNSFGQPQQGIANAGGYYPQAGRAQNYGTGGTNQMALQTQAQSHLQQQAPHQQQQYLYSQQQQQQQQPQAIFQQQQQQALGGGEELQGIGASLAGLGTLDGDIGELGMQELSTLDALQSLDIEAPSSFVPMQSQAQMMQVSQGAGQYAPVSQAHFQNLQMQQMPLQQGVVGVQYAPNANQNVGQMTPSMASGAPGMQVNMGTAGGQGPQVQYMPRRL